jgi:cell wall-associated NlpC family hydrolase
MKYEHLIGRPFIHGSMDCYGLIRDFYKDNYDIELTNYARPDNWWDQGLNLYVDNYLAEGFEIFNGLPKDYLPGDAFLMALRSPVANHAGVLLDDGRILHHLYGSLSTADSFRPLYRDTMVAVLRHPMVAEIEQQKVTTVDLTEIMPDAIRARLTQRLPDA